MEFITLLNEKAATFDSKNQECVRELGEIHQKQPSLMLDEFLKSYPAFVTSDLTEYVALSIELFEQSTFTAQSWYDIFKPRLALDDREFALLQSLSVGVSNAGDVLSNFTSVLETNIMNGGNTAFKVDVNHAIDNRDRRVLIWLLLSIALIMYSKDSKCNVARTILGVSVGATLYYESDNVKHYVMKIVTSFYAQSNNLVSLLIEGASLFIFGRTALSKIDGISSLADQLGAINVKSSGFTLFVNRMVEWLENLISLIARSFGYNLRLQTSVYDDRIERIVNRLQPLERLQLDNEMFSAAHRDSAQIIYEDAQDLFRDAISRIGKEKFSPTENMIRSILQRSSIVYNYAKQCVPGLGDRDMEPFVVILVGYPGVGKDVYAPAIAEYLTINALNDEERIEWQTDPGPFAPYTKSEASPYWNGLSRKSKVLLMPELFATDSLPGDENSSEAQFLNLVSGQTMPLNMADVDSKGKYYARFSAIVATTNYAGGTTRTFKSVKDEGAIFRRMRNHTWIQFVDVRFSRPGNPDAAKGFTIPLAPELRAPYMASLDVEAINRFLIDNPDANYTVAYRFQKYDIERAQPFMHEPILSEEEFREQVVNDFRYHLETKRTLHLRRLEFTRRVTNEYLAQAGAVPGNDFPADPTIDVFTFPLFPYFHGRVQQYLMTPSVVSPNFVHGTDALTIRGEEFGEERWFGIMEVNRYIPEDNTVLTFIVYGAGLGSEDVRNIPDEFLTSFPYGFSIRTRLRDGVCVSEYDPIYLTLLRNLGAGAFTGQAFSGFSRKCVEIWKRMTSKYLDVDNLESNMLTDIDIFERDENSLVLYNYDGNEKGKIQLLLYYLGKYRDGCLNLLKRLSMSSADAINFYLARREALRMRWIRYFEKDQRIIVYNGQSKSSEIFGKFSDICLNMFERFSNLSLRAISNLIVLDEPCTILALYKQPERSLLRLIDNNGPLNHLYGLGHDLSVSFCTKIGTFPLEWWGVLGTGLFVAIGAGVALKLAPMVKRLFGHDFDGSSESFTAQAFPTIKQEDKFVNKMLMNQYLLRVCIVNNIDTSFKRVELNYGLFVKDRYMLTVKHGLDAIFTVYDFNSYTIFLEFYSNGNTTRNEPDFKVDFGEFQYEALKEFEDLCIVYLPPRIRQHLDVTKAMICKSDHALVNASRQPGHCLYRYIDAEGLTCNKLDMCRTVSQHVYGRRRTMLNVMTNTVVDFPEVNHMVHNALITKVAFEGACGIAIFMDIKNKAFSYSNQPLLTHVHVAGGTINGLAVPVFRDYFDHLPSNSIDRYNQFVTTFSNFKEIAGSHGLETKDIEFVELHQIDGSQIGQIPIASRSVASFSKPSQLKRSPLFEDPDIHAFFNEKCPGIHDDPPRPAVMKYVAVTGEDGLSRFVHVAEKAYMPYGNNSRGYLSNKANDHINNLFNVRLVKALGEYRIPSLVCDLISDDYLVKNNIDISGYSVKEYSLLEQYFRITRGFISDDPMLRRSCVDRNKSVGPVINFVTGLNTRLDLYGDGPFPEFDSVEELAVRELYIDMVKKLCAGEQLTVIMKGCLKDELRPKSRVKIGKTRLFSNGDWCFLVLCMALFGDCIYNHKSARINNNMLVGINPYNRHEWSEMADRLKSKNECGLVGATDHSGFDTNCREYDFENFSNYLKLYYIKASDFNEERELLLKSMFDYFMIINSGDKETVYSMTKSLCSGWFITSLFGSYTNLYLHTVSFMSLRAQTLFGKNDLILNTLDANQMRKVFELVSEELAIFVYGDDSIFSTFMTNIYNVPAIADAMFKLVGSKLTNENEDVDGVDEYGYVNLTRSMIIARSFNPMIVNGEFKYLANLRFVSILKSLYWSKKDGTIDIERNKIDLAYREMALHGESVHSEFVKVMRPKVLACYDYISPYENYNYALSQILDTVYCPFDGDEFVEMGVDIDA